MTPWPLAEVEGDMSESVMITRRNSKTHFLAGCVISIVLDKYDAADWDCAALCLSLSLSDSSWYNKINQIVDPSLIRLAIHVVYGIQYACIWFFTHYWRKSGQFYRADINSVVFWIHGLIIKQYRTELLVQSTETANWKFPEKTNGLRGTSLFPLQSQITDTTTTFFFWLARFTRGFSTTNKMASLPQKVRGSLSLSLNKIKTSIEINQKIWLNEKFLRWTLSTYHTFSNQLTHLWLHTGLC